MYATAYPIKGMIDRLNKEMSDKYGLHIYDAWNPYNPYYVKEWDGCYTEDEIAHPETIQDWNNYCPTCPNVDLDVVF